MFSHCITPSIEFPSLAPWYGCSSQLQSPFSNPSPLSASQSAEFISEEDLQKIADHLPHDWQHLGNKLGVQYSVLESFRTAHPTQKAAMEMLKCWQKTKGKAATRKKLKEALEKLGYGRLAKEVFGKQPPQVFMPGAVMRVWGIIFREREFSNIHVSIPVLVYVNQNHFTYIAAVWLTSKYKCILFTLIHVYVHQQHINRVVNSLDHKQLHRLPANSTVQSNSCHLSVSSSTL